VLKVFDHYLKVDELEGVIKYFANGSGMEVSDAMPAGAYRERLRSIPGLAEAAATLGKDGGPGLAAAATEFILEGLHLHQKLNKKREGGRYTYRA
jgi:magnesium chelatase subunit I